MSDLVAASLFAISQYEANKKDRPDFDPMEYIIEYDKGKLITVQELLDFFMEHKDERKSESKKEVQTEQALETVSTPKKRRTKRT